MTISYFDKGIRGGADVVTGDTSKTAGKEAKYIMSNFEESTAQMRRTFNDILGVTNNLKENAPHEMVNNNGVLGGNVPEKS